MTHAPTGPEPSLCFGVREHVSSRRVRCLSARQIADSSFCECACWLLLPLNLAPSHTCAEVFSRARPYVDRKYNSKVSMGNSSAFLWCLQPASFACADLPLRMSCAVQQICKPPSLSRLLSPVAFRLSLAALI